MASILVVDDNRVARFYAQAVLEAAGHSVKVSDCPQGARDEVGRECFDLVLVDLDLGSARGDDLVRTMQPRPEHCETRFVLYSGQEPEELEWVAMSCGADGYLSKSPRPDLFAKQVDQLVGLG